MPYGHDQRQETGAERVVHLLPQAVQALQIMRPYTHAKGPEADVFERPAWVPGARGGRPQPSGQWTDGRQLRETYWNPALMAAKVRKRRMYATRHTFASVMTSAGVPVVYVAQQLGHSVQMLLSTYARWLPDAAESRERIKQLFSNAGTATSNGTKEKAPVNQ